MPDEAERLAAVARALGHAFSDPLLLRQALTHRSLAHERPRLAPCDNERLEFLGDAVVGMVASALLCARFPLAREGELTRRRADLVCEGSLAQAARELGLGEALRLGIGEERTGGRDKPRLLAGALEACLGAVYLDGGQGAALAAGERLLGPRLSADAPGAGDFKSRIQELVQADGRPSPTYELLRTEGPDHERSFHVAVQVEGEILGEGAGRSKLEAEQEAARVACERLRAPTSPPES